MSTPGSHTSPSRHASYPLRRNPPLLDDDLRTGLGPRRRFRARNQFFQRLAAPFASGLLPNPSRARALRLAAANGALTPDIEGSALHQPYQIRALIQSVQGFAAPFRAARIVAMPSQPAEGSAANERSRASRLHALGMKAAGRTWSGPADLSTHVKIGRAHV